MYEANSSPHDVLRHSWITNRRRSTFDESNYGEGVIAPSSINCGGEATQRTLIMKDCTSDCERNYYLYLPSAACGGDGDGSTTTIDNIGTLPLVFAVHCLGCTPDVMMHWTGIAEQFDFVLAIPEGLHHSFNGQYCCGYALEQGLDDVGFLQSIIQELDQDFTFVSSDLAYAFGWSNGGYLVSYASRLFRAIAPISGYQVDITANPKWRTAIFLHHAEDDRFVRISGCCTNSSMPECCCGLSKHTDTCTSAELKMQEWASLSINDCHDSVPEEPRITFEKPDSVTCYGYSNCKANTTFCIHQNKGHFNNPSFETKFSMTTEIAEFFAQHACQTNGGGQWTTRCICPVETEPESHGKKYCHTIEASSGIPLTFAPTTLASSDLPRDAPPATTGSSFVVVALSLIAFGLFLVAHYCSSSRRRSTKGFANVSTVELELRRV